MRLLWKKYRGNNWPHSGSQERSRIDVSAKAKKSSSFGIFSPESEVNTSIKKFIPHIHPHFQGMSVWRIVHTSYFAKEARYDLDMPLIASQSDSIALLLIPAMVIGKLTDDDLMVYNLGAISFLVGDGHHSIHEFKTVWNAFNIPYIDGDYASIFPDGFIQAHPELLELQKHFPDLLSLKSDPSQLNLFK